MSYFYEAYNWLIEQTENEKYEAENDILNAQQNDEL
jgi:hypothetical protein